MLNYIFFIFLGTNYCLSNPCQNGGRCVSGYGQYVCTCTTGYAGINCQRSTYI